MLDQTTQEKQAPQEPPKIRELRERLKLAKEIGAVNQARMLDDAIDVALALHKIEQVGTWPEVRPRDARIAFCEPYMRWFAWLRECPREGCTKSLPHRERVYKWELWREVVEVKEPPTTGSELKLSDVQKAAHDIQRLGQGQVVVDKADDVAPRAGLSGLLEQAYSQNMSMLFNSGRRSDSVVMPMAALCRLKEANDKDVFDYFEIWRPISKQAYMRLVDPWLVGVVGERFFKLCDWR